VSRRDLFIGELEQLCADSSRVIARTRGLDALRGALRPAALLAIAVPGLHLVLSLFAGGALLGFSGVLVLTVTAVISVLFVAWVTTWAEPVEQGDALSVLDAQVGLEGRLAAAHAFLGGQRPGSFAEAAIEDAAGHIDHARGALITLAPTTAIDPRLRFAPLVSLALLTLGALLGSGGMQHTAHAAASEDEDLAFAPAVEGESEVEEARPPATPPELVPAPEEVQAGAPREQPGGSKDQPGEISDEVKESAGKTGRGRSAEAKSKSSAGASRGAPSDQAQPSKQPPKPPKPGQKPKAKKDRKKPEEARRKEPEPAGATTGTGASKGSGKNPTASEWTCKDQVSAPDDAEIEEDDDTEDDDEEQEQRGGVQPSLRDRRPPVSRDLRIGFGNRPNPDANGRGGPSQPKKSRGVASLVLGVPIPDRVKGQPGPGRTKVTQERIEPEAEDARPVAASARSPRSLPDGRVSKLELEPWLRGVVTSYFLSMRSKDTP